MRGFLTAAWTRRCVLAVAVVSCTLTVRAADEDGSSEALLPPDTYLFLSCPSVTDLKARFAESAGGKLWKDRSMSAFRSQLDAHFDEAAAKVQEQVGIPLSDLLALPSGEVTVAASKVKNKLGFAAIVDVGDNTDTLEKVIAKIDEAMSKQLTAASETYQEIELTIYRQGDGKAGEMVHFEDESYVVFTSSVDLAKAIIDRWDGKHEKTFAKNPVFQTILEECEESDEAYSDLYFYVDPVNFALETGKLNPKSAGNIAMAQGFLPILGLDKLKAIGGAVSFESEDFDSVSRTMFYVDKPVTGVLAAFQMPATLDAPPKWVGKSVDQYTGANWDVQGAYKAVDSLVQMFAPQIGSLDALMDQAAQHPNNPGIHPKKDLIDQLTGQIHAIGVEDQNDAEADTRMLVAIGVKDEKTVQNVMEKVAAQAPNLKPRQFEGVTIYDIEAGSGATPSLAIVRGQLFFATHPAGLEAVIRGKSQAEEPLSEAEDYKAVAEHFETPASSIGFSRPAAQIKGIWELARKGTFNEQLKGLDLTTLPEFSAIEKYLTPSGSYIAPHEKGAVWVNFSLPVE